MIIGYKEIPGGGVNRIHHTLLIGNCAYICKKNTEFTNEWYNNMITLLDEKLEMLKKNPAKHPRDSFDKNSKYPIEWVEMLGCIFHPLILKYKNKVLNTLPLSIFNNYE